MSDIPSNIPTHACQPGRDAAELPRAMYGPAILPELYFKDGTWMASNDEYATVVYYCPWCGLKLPDNPG